MDLDEVKSKKHQIKLCWIIPLKWGIAIFSLSDLLITSGLIYLSFDLMNKVDKNDLIYFVLTTDGIIALMFLIKMFFGLTYAKDICCPPKSKKYQNKDVLGRGKVLIVKQQRRSLGNYFTASSVAYFFTAIQSALLIFLFLNYSIDEKDEKDENTEYQIHLYKSIGIFLICLIGIVFTLRKMNQQMRIQNEELQVRLPKQLDHESEQEDLNEQALPVQKFIERRLSNNNETDESKKKANQIS